MHYLRRGNAIPLRYVTFYEYRCAAAASHGEESRLFISYENLGTVSASGDNAPLPGAENNTRGGFFRGEEKIHAARSLNGNRAWQEKQSIMGYRYLN